jgi:hypothetical protein
MLSDIVQVQPDIELVGHAEGPDELPEAVARQRPDVLVVIPSGKVGRCLFEDLLYAAPRLRVLAIVENGHAGLLYRLRPSRARLGEMSAAALLDAIRDAATPTPLVGP